MLLRRAPDQDWTWRCGWLLPDALLLFREHELLAALVQLCLSNQVKRASKFQMETPEGRVVSRIAQISYCVERLLDTEHIVQRIGPPLLVLGDELAQPNGYYRLVIVELVRVEPKEVKKQFAQCLLVLASISSQLGQIIGKFARLAIFGRLLLVRVLVEGG